MTEPTANGKRYEDVQLASAPRDQKTSPISRSGTYQPLGLLSLASNLRRQRTDCSIRLLDGEFLGVHEIEKQLDGDLVGVSSTTPSYTSALQLLRTAKKNGAATVLGGAHATALGETILRNQPEIDFVIRGDGETALAELSKGRPLAEIPNLVYRKGGEVVANPVRPVSLASLPPLERELLPLAPYLERYSQQDGAVPGRRPAAIVSQKGCMWRHQSGGCLFCGRLEQGWRSRPVDQVWGEVTSLREHWGVNYVWDVSDSFVSSRDWLFSFTAQKPVHLDMEFFVYARSCELDSEVVQALIAIGCKEIFIGMESGEDHLLRAANKGTTVEDNIRASKLLASHGMRIFPCFVVGLPGETPETLGRTVGHAAHLSRLCEWSTVSASVLVPLPGSRAFATLLQTPEGHREVHGRDKLDVESLGRLWVDGHCTASWEEIHDAIDAILDLGPRKSSFFSFRN